MFGFSKQKKLPFDELGAVLLDTANAIIQASSAESDTEVAMQGAIAVATFVAETKKHYGIDMHPDSSFARYIKFYVGPQDVDKMAGDTRYTAKLLLECTSDVARAKYIYFWYTGDRI